MAKIPLPGSIDETMALLAKADYVADRSLATVLYLALTMGRPLFVEGEAGVGKTEIAKVLSKTLGRRLIRLQCYEGLDIASAVYEWNYGAQMIAIRLAEVQGEHDRSRTEQDIFSEKYLIKRPLLQALEPNADGPPVLLIDELDRTDEAFEVHLHDVVDGDPEVVLDHLDQLGGAGVEGRVDAVVGADLGDQRPGHGHQGVARYREDRDLVRRRIDVPDHVDVAALAADGGGRARLGGLGGREADPRVRPDDQHVDGTAVVGGLGGHRDLPYLVEAVTDVEVATAEDPDDQQHDGQQAEHHASSSNPP